MLNSIGHVFYTPRTVLTEITSCILLVVTSLLHIAYKRAISRAGFGRGRGGEGREVWVGVTRLGLNSNRDGNGRPFLVG